MEGTADITNLSECLNTWSLNFQQIHENKTEERAKSIQVNDFENVWGPILYSHQLEIARLGVKDKYYWKHTCTPSPLCQHLSNFSDLWPSVAGTCPHSLLSFCTHFSMDRKEHEDQKAKRGSFWNWLHRWM